MSDSDPAAPLDLKFLPSWLKEDSTTVSQRYADYEGGSDRRPQRRDRPPGRPGSGFQPNRGPRREGPGGLGPRPQGSPRPSFPNRDSGGRPGNRPPQHQTGGPRREYDRGQDRRPQHAGEERIAEQAAPVNVQFLPEEIALEKVTAQIKGSPAAYPLFGVARMFLQRPERHHVRFSPAEGATLFKLKGTSLISTDRSRLEAIAFKETRDQWFRIEEGEAAEIKGNFTSVARSTLTGKLLGPTNYHTFQTALRKEYDERFSKRMSFGEYRQKVETTNDPALVEQWKQESRRTETFMTLQAEIEETFPSPIEAELYFKREILPTLIEETTSEVMSGQAARDQRDATIIAAVRAGWDKETKFPITVVNEIRNHLQSNGLHIFKFKKRILLVSSIRPVPMDEKSDSLSPSIRSVLATLRQNPGINRKQLAEKILGSEAGLTETDMQSRKTILIGDLYWLARQGHVIEFADGTLDLPLAHKTAESSKEAAPVEETEESLPVEHAEPTEQPEAISQLQPNSNPSQQQTVEAAEAVPETEFTSESEPELVAASSTAQLQQQEQ
ncbi:MAG TPA: hypothetical protein VIT21_08630 [Chthoniobacterales bacterium]